MTLTAVPLTSPTVPGPVVATLVIWGGTVLVAFGAVCGRVLLMALSCSYFEFRAFSRGEGALFAVVRTHAVTDSPPTTPNRRGANTAAVLFDCLRPRSGGRVQTPDSCALRGCGCGSWLCPAIP